MATSATNSYTGKGIAESFEDIILIFLQKTHHCYQWQKECQQVKPTINGKQML